MQFLDVLPRVADFLSLPEFSASIQLNHETREASANGEVKYATPVDVFCPPLRDVSQCTPGATMGTLLNVNLHVFACSGLIMRSSLLQLLSGLTRVVRLSVHVVGGRLDVLVHALRACGNAWQFLTELDIFINEVQWSFPCARDPLSPLMSIDNVRTFFARKPWPSLQRASIQATCSCPKCMHWFSGSRVVLEGAKWSGHWKYPIAA